MSDIECQVGRHEIGDCQHEDVMNEVEASSLPSHPLSADTLGDLITSLWQLRHQWHKRCAAFDNSQCKSLTHEICDRIELLARDMEDIIDERQGEVFDEGLMVNGGNTTDQKQLESSSNCKKIDSFVRKIWHDDDVLLPTFEDHRQSNANGNACFEEHGCHDEVALLRVIASMKDRGKVKAKDDVLSEGLVVDGNIDVEKI